MAINCRAASAGARWWWKAAAAAGLLFVSAGCHGRHEKVFIEDDEKQSDPQPVSAFKMYEPAASRQLLAGFYGLEANAWRWTARDFVMSFKTPPDANRLGATVAFDFVIPEVVIRKVAHMRLAAAVRGKEVGATEYRAPGSYTFKANLPAALCADPVTVIDFHLDRAMPPGEDSRELGVIAQGAALTVP